ncbi:protein shortage in chiasmata 1 ortholog-like, partial [Eriocheir sinensis]|uniref:protein shortage in chiasmata 1 ortholog-like n=1 Tax=Eriocheir sinensis TaxID=95602 RepID=UPI0021CAC978
MARLEAVLERKGEGAVHPKVTILRQEMQRARQREDPGDTEFKVLVAARREAQWVCCQLQEEFGSGTVALLPRMPEYDHVLHLLERRSILVWEEGEALHQLPCSQFSLVVEWEGSSSSSVCVDHCTRQNIHVVSFMSSSSTSEQETVSREGNRDQHELKGNTIITSGNESQGGTGSSRGQGQRDILTVVASDCVTANTELHYILTSMVDINLVERNARNIMLEEGSQGWADLLLDERTCVLLQPLATLRSDAHLNELTCHLVLLSLQCTTCYIIMYSQQSSNSGYEFRSSMVRALARLVATCVLFCSPEYTVSLLLAHDLKQVGKVVRELCEAARTSSSVWDPEEWTTRPWLTPQMSSHERLLLSLPCINSISAQVILTAMSLLQVLESPVHQLRKALPWIP